MGEPALRIRPQHLHENGHAPLTWLHEIVDAHGVPCGGCRSERMKPSDALLLVSLSAAATASWFKDRRGRGWDAARSWPGA